MPEEVKKCTEKAATLLNSVTHDKREMAVIIAETFAAGLATGVELTESKQAAED